MIGRPLSFVAAALIVITSAVYYADTRMKTKDNFFRGFPVTWNMVVFTLFAATPNEWMAFLFVVLCSATTFLPIKFLHPVRVARLRALNLTVLGLWCGFGILALFYTFDSPTWVRAGILLSAIYLFSIGAVLQLLDRVRGRSPEQEPYA
jgi:phosphatidylcholine synthase